ncbi:peptidase [bacterium]|nr:MAG: peptidase [bacterium]
MSKILRPIAALLLLALSGCSTPEAGFKPEDATLPQARYGFKTKLDAPSAKGEPAEAAPPAVFTTAFYPAAAGKLKAFVTPNPKDGKKHPAIVWITGGDSNSIGDLWSPAPADNDQNATAFRQAGIVLMFPSLRGGNDNPGVKEGFLGEVDDILAATKWLAEQPYVDKTRIYLGGHSTGGTLALLVAESSKTYRNVFAFGPVGDVAGYGKESGFLPFDIKNDEEVVVRSPLYWLDSIESPTWVIEGTEEGNIDSLQEMKKESKNAKVHFLAVQGATHFDVLAPTNKLIAQKILADIGPTTNIDLNEAELTQNFAKK